MKVFEESEKPGSDEGFKNREKPGSDEGFKNQGFLGVR